MENKMNEMVINMEIEAVSISMILSRESHRRSLDLQCEITTVIDDTVVSGQILVRPFGRKGTRVGADGEMPQGLLEFVRSEEVEEDIVDMAVLESGVDMEALK